MSFDMISMKSYKESIYRNNLGEAEYVERIDSQD
jgi:hypothetical protein